MYGIYRMRGLRCAALKYLRVNRFSAVIAQRAAELKDNSVVVS
jgi:hypothetical protein